MTNLPGKNTIFPSPGILFSMMDDVSCRLGNGFPRFRNWRRICATSWRGEMPGVIRLADEVGAARNTVEAALRELERDGLLVPQGHGRGRLIDLKGGKKSSGLRVALLPSDVADRGLNYLIELEHELEAAGHQAFFTTESMDVMGMNADRIARMASPTSCRQQGDFG